MVAEWNIDRVKKIVKKYGRSVDDLRIHVGGELESLNPEQREQRIILIAEDYDYEVLITAKWLMEGHAVRVSCWQIALARDPAGSGDYLYCIQILPPKKLEELAIQRGRQRVAEAGQIRTIEQLLENCRNADEVAFFSKRLDQPRNGNRDALAIARVGVNRWYVEPRAEHASVYQVGRFPGDQNTWKDKIQDPQISPQSKGGLRFYLRTASDFENFVQFVENEGKNLTWTKESEPDEGERTASDASA